MVKLAAHTALIKQRSRFDPWCRYAGGDMPDQWERHSKSRWEWGTPGSRKQERQQAAHDDPLHPKVPGKKDPNRCKGNQGDPHVPALIYMPYGFHKVRGCGWDIRWSSKDNAYKPSYYCYHVEICVKCGKRFDKYSHQPPSDCPEYTPVIPERMVIAAEEATKKRAALLRRPRKVIKGPTHYRKKKN